MPGLALGVGQAPLATTEIWCFGFGERRGPAREQVECLLRFRVGLCGEGEHRELGVGYERHHLEGELERGERRCLAALGGQAAPDGYGHLELPAPGPASFLLELDRATEEHERLRQKARRYARALPRSELGDDNPVVVVAAPTPTRRDNLARVLATSSVPFRVIVWTPGRSPLAALREVLPLASTNSSALDDPTALAPPPAPHA